jgi:crotonobetainyl-CoA:carnitine CoA-transferase CaiB-like acyl-CoA transferase
MPYYQFDSNFGKHTIDLDLRDQSGRARFEDLLDNAVDVIVDDTDLAASRLGYGVEELKKCFGGIGKYFVYVAENCFGFKCPWKKEAGGKPSEMWSPGLPEVMESYWERMNLLSNPFPCQISKL